MADANDIIAMGFGSWSTVNWIPTLGFAIGAALTGIVTQYFTLMGTDDSSLALAGTNDASLSLDGTDDSSLAITGM